MSASADAPRGIGRYRRVVPRAPRSELPDRGVYHVTNRGVARCEIFGDDVDRQLFIARLRRLANTLSWKVSAYCLMTTHFHLLVAASRDALSIGMHRLQAPYAQGFNVRYGRVGHLFQERFHAKVISDELHFVAAYEYIRNNPVAAGLCDRAADWPWSGSI
jgi:REP element-mobilizing transposase RayT